MTCMGMVTAPQMCGRQEPRGDQLCDHKKASQARRRGLRSNFLLVHASNATTF
jgi:hypothetical protein